METTKVGDIKKEEVQGSITPQEFAEKYKKLVEETGYQLVAQPVWVGTNHGSFEMTIQLTIGKLPKQE